MTRGHTSNATLALALVAAQVQVGCAEHAETSREHESAAPGLAASTTPDLVAKMTAAESARAPALVPDFALVHHDARVRRAATRALARILDVKSLAALTQRLSDEDPEVVAWAALGLGALCAGHEPETVRALVARAASLGDETSLASNGARFVLDPAASLADGLARCGTEPAEQTLRAWLDGPLERARSAALALSRLAGRRHHLDDATTVALLDAAARPVPIDTALAPFARLDALPSPTMGRLHTVATRALSSGAAARAFAIRALGSAGPKAASTLADVVIDVHASTAERSLAATALGRLGVDGAPALARAVTTMVNGATLTSEHFVTETYTPLSAALAALAPPAEGASDALAALAGVAIPDGAAPAIRRRLVGLRCGASSILAGTASQSVRLVHCDPDAHGRVGALAALRVLDRGGLTAARFDAWSALATSADPGVRRAALAVIPMHPELPPITALLASALGAKEPGVVAEAALVLAASPRRASALPLVHTAASEDPKDPGTPAPEIVDALAKAMDAARPPDDVATRAALARAASRLGMLSSKPRIERLCASDNATLRRAAEEGLRALGSPSATCDAPLGKSGPPSSSAATATPAPSVTLAPTEEAGPLTLTFVTDAGRIGLTLDPTLAPLAVGRVAALARSGFYDGLPIQRVVPGLIVQLGDPVGDGYGGAGEPPLPSETSPTEFSALSVGIAVGGRDTASSQIFVTLSPEPALYGDYPIVGWADPEWASAAEGDVVRNVEIKR